MRLLNESPPYDLTYSDVFMVPSLSSVPSRFTVDLTHPRRSRHDDSGRGQQHDCRRRSSHGRDRRPSRRPHRAAARHPARRRRRRHRVREVTPPVYDTPITLSPTAHGRRRARADPQAGPWRAGGRRRRRAPVGIFTEHDAVGFDRFSQLKNVMSSDLMVIEDGTSPPTRSTTGSSGQRLSVAPVVDERVG